MNRMHVAHQWEHGTIGVTTTFGELLGVDPMPHVHGLGHEERVKARFRGASIEFSAAVFIEMLRRGPEAIAALRKHNGVDLSGSLADLADDIHDTAGGV